MKKLTANELAAKLEAKPGRLRRTVGTLLFSALLGASATAHASVYEVDGDFVVSFIGNPDAAHALGLSAGQQGTVLTGATGDHEIDDAITQGNIEGLGPPPSPPAPPPEPPGSLFIVPPDEPPPTNPTPPSIILDDPQLAYDIGFELAAPVFDAYSVAVENPSPDVGAAFDQGYDASVDGAAASCASCGGDAGDSGGCGSCGGCGGCG